MIEQQATDDINTIVENAEKGETLAIILENGTKLVAAIGPTETFSDSWWDGGTLHGYEIELEADMLACDPTPTWLRTAPARISAVRIDEEPYERPTVEAPLEQLDGTPARAAYDGPYGIERVEIDE